MKGAYLWGVKDWIDRGFMRKYSSDLDFGAMSAHGAPGSQGGQPHDQLGPEAVAIAAAAKMRCGGCGSKVGASALGRVLRRLRRDEEEAGAAAGGSGRSGCGSEAVLVGLESADDAAVLQAPPPGHVLVHSVDFFRALVDDPFLFGRIAANHALGDIYAMGRPFCPSLWIVSPRSFLMGTAFPDLVAPHHLLCGLRSPAPCRRTAGVRHGGGGGPVCVWGSDGGGPISDDGRRVHRPARSGLRTRGGPLLRGG